MKVIAIAGKATHGKDFTADILKEMLAERGKKVLILHYADYLKYLCKHIFNWDGNKDDAGRNILQFVGTDLARNNNPDIWVNVIVETIKAMKTEFDVFMISDSRFPNEIQNLKNNELDTISVKVNRMNYKSPLTTEQQNHPSETALDGYDFDYVLDFETGKENVIKAIEESDILDTI